MASHLGIDPQSDDLPIYPPDEAGTSAGHARYAILNGYRSLPDESPDYLIMPRASMTTAGTLPKKKKKKKTDTAATDATSPSPQSASS
jgi:hypothetical protein